MSKLEELGFELRHVGINCANEEEACTVEIGRAHV